MNNHGTLLGFIWCVLSPNESQESVEEDNDGFDRCRICSQKKRLLESIKDQTPNIVSYIMEKFPISDEVNLESIQVCYSCISLCKLQVNTKYGLEASFFDRNHELNCGMCSKDLVLNHYGSICNQNNVLMLPF